MISENSSKGRFRQEWDRFANAIRKLTPAQKQAAIVLIAATVLILLQLTFGTRSFFRTHFAESFAPENRALASWAWWFGWQGITGFLIPLIILLVWFKWKPSKAGIGLGDWKLALTLAAIYIPLVAIGTWFLSADPAFMGQYPHLRAAAFDWQMFAIYHCFFLIYWIGWEYIWRGFVLFGTAPAFGPVAAIVIQMVPFAVLHASKPAAEVFLSIIGGLALGALVWRCRSFWIAVPIHAAQMLILDLWCSLRWRTNDSGLGLESLWNVLNGF